MLKIKMNSVFISFKDEVNRILSYRYFVTGETVFFLIKGLLTSLPEVKWREDEI